MVCLHISRGNCRHRLFITISSFLFNRISHSHNYLQSTITTSPKIQFPSNTTHPLPTMAPTRNLGLIFKQVPNGWPKAGQDLAVEDRPIDLDQTLEPGNLLVKNYYA